jgi:methylated-DNA-protein-cysteine methyltransferase-like protein
MKPVRADVPVEHEAIRRVIASIPPGRVSSYGEVAARAGLPGRARLVGRVLGEAGSGAALPWQRVLRSDGRIAFPPGSRAFREQVRRLAGEGVLVRSGRVDLALHGWERDLDSQLWGPTVAAAGAGSAGSQASRPSMKIVRKVTRSAAKR